MRITTAIKPRKTTNWDSANALTGNAEIAAFVADALETNDEEYGNPPIFTPANNRGFIRGQVADALSTRSL